MGGGGAALVFVVFVFGDMSVVARSVSGTAVEVDAARRSQQVGPVLASTKIYENANLCKQ